jgi:hypothetical protein
MPILGLARPAFRRPLKIDLPQLTVCVHWALVTIAFVECFRGKGRPFQVMLLTLLVPAMRFLTDAEYRLSCRIRLRDRWQRVVDYAKPGGAIPWSAVFWLVVFPAVLLNLSTNRFLATGDSWPVVPTAFSLVTDGNLELSEQLHLAAPSYFVEETGLPYCVTRRGDNLYSSYPPGMVVFATPVCIIARLCGADFGADRVRQRLERFTAAWVGAACLALFFLIAVRIENVKTAAVVGMFLAVGSAMVTTVGHGLWQHGGVIFWCLSAFLMEVHFLGRHSARVSILQGISLAMMLACRPSAGIILAVMLAWIGLRSMKRGLFVAIGVAIGVLPWAILYECIYGTMVGPSQSQMAWGNWGMSRESVLGVLISPARGLFVYQPWLLLGMLAPICKRTPTVCATQSAKAPSGWISCCTAAIVLQILLVANWKCWWGGACWGSRLLADIVPFAALVCLPPTRLLTQRRWGIAVLVVLGLLAAGSHFCILHDLSFSPGTRNSIWDWSQFPFNVSP